MVSIGIFIALQANNWNEQRKAKIQELELLKSLKIELERDLTDIDHNVKGQKEVAYSGNLLLEAMENKVSYSDSIANHFARVMLPTSFLYTTSTFETIKSNGVDLVSNPAVRNKMIEVFDTQYKFFLQNESSFHDFGEHVNKTIFSGHFEESYSYDLSSADYKGKLVPLNFEKLRQDVEFLYYFKSFFNRNLVHIEVNYANLRAQVSTILELLGEEIEGQENS